jgi:mRNA-degrading endonuclease toxin of MazEF toxin-antitoxin module
MTRGSILWVNLEDADPPEMGKTRPAVIVSNSEQNALLDTVVVVPLSSRPPAIWPLRLELVARSAKRIRKSYAVVPGIRQVDKRRLLGGVGRVPDDFLEELTKALATYLGD